MRIRLPSPHRSSIGALMRGSDVALGRWLADHALALRPVALQHGRAVASLLGLPLGEVVASPFGFRMCVMGAQLGVRSVAHETRRIVPWHPSIRPGVDEADEGGWEHGALAVAKYRQFAADEPRTVYRPDQHAKWAPHELLHRACGFFSHPEASRFELYLGARLNELLPVATWYGIEQHLRLDELGPFDRAVLGRNEARIEDAFWLEAKRDALEERAIAAAPVFREGLAHLTRELAACRGDLRLGTVTTTRHPHAFLDAASDALGYVAMHAARLLSPAVAAVHRRNEHDADLGRYLRRIERCRDALLFAPLLLDTGAFEGHASARRRWDHALRHAQQQPDDGAGARALAAGRMAPARSIALDGEAHDLAQLRRGLRDAVPSVLDRVPKLASALVADPAFVARAPLAERVARMFDGPLADLARLEGAMADKRGIDDRAEILDDRPARTRPTAFLTNRTFTLHRFATDPLSLVERTPAGPGPSAVLIGRFRGQTMIVPLRGVEANLYTERRYREMPMMVLSALMNAGAVMPVGTRSRDRKSARGRKRRRTAR